MAQTIQPRTKLRVRKWNGRLARSLHGVVLVVADLLAESIVAAGAARRGQHAAGTGRNRRGRRAVFVRREGGPRRTLVRADAAVSAAGVVGRARNRTGAVAVLVVGVLLSYFFSSHPRQLLAKGRELREVERDAVLRAQHRQTQAVGSRTTRRLPIVDHQVARVPGGV